MNNLLPFIAALLFNSPCLAQLRSKMEIRNSNPKRILLNPTNSFVFMDGEKFEDYVKLIGRDDTLSGHTKAMPIVKNDSIVFMNYMPFILNGDSTISVHGPCLIRDYNLTAEAAKEKKIAWIYPEYTEIKHVYHDDSGRAYILHAYSDRTVELKAEEVVKLKMMNYDLWVWTEKQGYWLKYRQTLNKQFCTLVGLSGCSVVLLGMAEVLFFF